ncbi:MAG: hypothetical protein U1F87_18925 [Kiritimatiellia bacterium]
MNPEHLPLLLMLAPGLALAQVSPNFELEAHSSLPTAQATQSAGFLIDGSLGNVFSQVSTSPFVEIAAGVIPHRLPEDFNGPFIDFDRDNLADGWEVFYFGSRTVATASGNGDFDAANNAAEQLAGTSPLLPGSVFHVTEVRRSGGHSHVFWTGAAGRPYRVDYAPAPGLHHLDPVGNASTDAAGMAVWEDADPARSLSSRRGITIRFCSGTDTSAPTGAFQPPLPGRLRPRPSDELRKRETRERC